jgi:hypothetical protein
MLNQLLGATFLFSNIFFAVLYLALPYIAMVAIDWYMKKRQKQNEKLEEINHEYTEPLEEQEEMDSNLDV